MTSQSGDHQAGMLLREPIEVMEQSEFHQFACCKCVCALIGLMHARDCRLITFRLPASCRILEE